MPNDKRIKKAIELVMNRMADIEQANTLMRMGYRRTSNSARMVSRIDRSDWKEYMAKKHSPWNIEQGMEWVEALGVGAPDYYRRVYGEDKVILNPSLYKLIKGSNHDPIGYIDLKTVDFILKQRKEKTR